ncbi:hypothetical protein IPA_04490 [Ignicoccus pacificus DSM 13166]|uniref:Uncharacterized protein n=1 Tax=Ignicoccus pacificus DSM 13166 TaxID=940294 RepID=A0A977PKW7_9CREN|nr:hypothetical protein IPA_04490 [Ignicoccus pacificus DSM 13166]
MSVVWRPSWKIVTVNYHGIRIRVLFDEKTKLYACPLCFKGTQEGSFYFDVDSLIQHMVSHVR